ncbi:SGNH/GDSL hydrolase family protein [Polaribacter porphyrae]|uniref:Lysophospholipase n=1 Tax=Polaribacter porphyrae TaxID=1137780 RepID=A0A2S7WTV6_9FLAO|nr:SGNH/GDSL hydrolase family protein [Polaribacter porphyrae]PQJ81035.1 lysophospholipase [Polaribacter porphyrae]
MKYFWIYFLTFLSLLSCGTSNEIVQEITKDETIDIVNPQNPIKILSLGDSYTIGQNVCDNCKFPSQLKDSIIKKTGNQEIYLKVIAKTGWTTTNLIKAIDDENLNSDYNIVTLLIGVNNQYQHKDFSIYEREFPELVNTAISKVNNRSDRLIVLSIPDYAFTPFGNGNTEISEDINRYNTFAENFCAQNNITYLNITDITRQGLANTNLVANDGLHPSEKAYTKFVERLLPLALEKLNL